MPVAVPGILGGVVQLQLALEVLEHTQIVQGVDLAGHELRQGAHMGAGDGVAGSNAGAGWVSSRYSDDGHGLRQQPAVVQLKRRHQRVAQLAGVGGQQLFALSRFTAT